MRLVLIGLAAGFFSALFGVGGGVVMVPLLITAAAFVVRPAMATSLAAIGLISAEGVIFYAAHGELKPRTLSLAFAALLAGLGVKLLL